MRRHWPLYLSLVVGVFLGAQALSLIDQKIAARLLGLIILLYT